MSGSGNCWGGSGGGALWKGSQAFQSELLETGFLWLYLHNSLIPIG